jgi:aryl-phospho-beta-D-glucosidase BglC (GH1 family)
MKLTNRRNYILRILCSIFLLVVLSVTLFLMQVYQHSKVKAAVTMPYVQGNQIIDGYGNPLVLRGAHIQSILDRYKQYATTADHLAYNHLNSATFDEMVNNWHMNTVRIATSDYVWQRWSYGGPTAYIQTLQNIVTQANQAGLYVVLSMHEELSSGLSPSQKEPSGWAMPTPLAVNYWQTVASTFKNNPMVMFDLYNEPHVNKTALTMTEPDWQFWLNGGTINYTTPNGIAKTYTVVGMQTLVNAIRAQGANQIIITQPGENSFLKFESDCPQTTLHCNFLQDPANTSNPNIVYSVHEYFVPIGSTPRQPPFWDGKFGILSKEVPIFIGEWEFSINTTYLTRCEDVTGTRSMTADEATTLVDSFLQYMDGANAGGQKISWTTFAFTWGQMFTDQKYLNYTPATLYTTPPFICGSKVPMAGDGWLIQQYLMTGVAPTPSPSPTDTPTATPTP